MPLLLKYSTSTSRLIEDLVESLAQSTADPSVTLQVLLPSRPLVERVRIALARKVGVVMGVDFVLPANFVEGITQGVDIEERHESWTPEGMFWRLLPLVEALAVEGKHPRVTRACLDLPSRLALAQETADRFDQYMHFRPELIAAWDKGEAWEDLPSEYLEDENWQRALWQGLSEALKDHPHPAKRWSTLVEKVMAGEGNIPERVEILATGPLPPLLMPLLRALGTRTDVHLRMFMPSSEYLGDIRSRRSQWKRDKELDRDWEANPLLAHLGFQAIQTFVVNELEYGDQGQEYQALDEGLVETPPVSLLSQIQSDIRAARQPEGNWVYDTADPSLRAHRCHGPRREVETLRDELLHAFQTMPGLKAEEVLILAPDLETYGPLCMAILKNKMPSLPLKLAEIRVDQSDPLLLALARLLQTASGRVTLSEVKGLLELQAVEARFNESGTLQALSRRLEASGVTFGLDGKHRASLGAGSEETGTWASALDRLSAGLWMGAEAAVEGPEGLELPAAGQLDGGAEESMQGLTWLGDLVSILRHWQSPADPAVWADRLRQAMASLLAAQEFDAGRALEIIEGLHRAASVHDCNSKLDAAGIAEIIIAHALDDRRAVVTVGGAIALGGLKPLRALPCRVMAILGLQDGAFPRKTRAPAWDLLGGAFRLGDRNLLLEDRQLFLDALLAAKERVILTASARGLRDDKAAPFSSCVDELLRAAEATAPGSAEKLIVEHKLQPFDPVYFASKTPSFDAASLILAKAGFDPNRDESAFYEAPKTKGEAVKEHALELEEVIKRLRRPSEAWLKNIDIRLPFTGGEDEALDSEPVGDLNALERWSLRSDLVQAQLKGDSNHLLQRLSANRQLGYGWMGKAVGDQYLGEAQEIARLAREVCGGAFNTDTLRLELDNIELSGSLQVAVNQSAILKIYFSDLKEKAQYRFDAWLRSLFAAAAGLKADTALIWVASNKIITRRIPAIALQDAKKRLKMILHLAHQAQQGPLCFAPATSEKIWFAAVNQADAAGEAQAVWQADFGDGENAYAQLAWRGLDPFSDANIPQWQSLADPVFSAMSDWWGTGS